MLTDTHCHLDFHKFNEDRESVIQRAREVGVGRMLIPGLELISCKVAVKMANAHPDIFAAVGFHPTDLKRWNDYSISDLQKLAKSSKKVVAIGEIGLDYYWVQEPEQRAFQRETLKKQLGLAQELNLPVVIHMREENDAWSGQASIDLLEILIEWHNKLKEHKHPLAERPGVLHSFNGTLETAMKVIEHNFYIGVTGPVTYKSADEKRKIIRQVPLERLLIETDSPFLTPVPHRGQRNEPAFVSHIADKIAEIHMTTLEQVAEVTTTNSNHLFGWGG